MQLTSAWCIYLHVLHQSIYASYLWLFHSQICCKKIYVYLVYPFHPWMSYEYISINLVMFLLASSQSSLWFWASSKHLYFEDKRNRRRNKQDVNVILFTVWFLLDGMFHTCTMNVTYLTHKYLSVSFLLRILKQYPSPCVLNAVHCCWGVSIQCWIP